MGSRWGQWAHILRGHVSCEQTQSGPCPFLGLTLTLSPSCLDIAFSPGNVFPSWASAGAVFHPSHLRLRCRGAFFLSARPQEALL